MGHGITRWSAEGVECDAEPDEAEKLIKECGFEGPNQVATSGTRSSFEEVEKDELFDPSPPPRAPPPLGPLLR